ncbi:MAG: hypothetical protein U9Q84_06175 [Thermodesulfobacteriota bacterium]|nr:hypothetical protein [Thermodesulfobacteriota bacterium]
MSIRISPTVFFISVLDLYPGQMALASLLEEKLSAKIYETPKKGKKIVEKENLPCETVVNRAEAIFSGFLTENYPSLRASAF